MNRSLLYTAAVAAAVLTTACSQMPHSAGMQQHGPAPDAQHLWTHLQHMDYQKNYKLFPGKGKLYQGVEPHGMLLTTYVNETAYNALSGSKGALPAGSILVKENYMPDKTLASVTVMYKSPGFDVDNNDWYWLKRGADGKVEAAGKAAGCIACHRLSPRDYIRTPLPM